METNVPVNSQGRFFSPLAMAIASRTGRSTPKLDKRTKK